MNAAATTEDAGDAASSEDDNEIPTLCDLDDFQAASSATEHVDEQLPPVPVTILTGA